MDVAGASVKRCFNVTLGQGEVEIRPFYEAGDLADVLPPEPVGAAPRDPMRQKLGVAYQHRPELACLPSGPGRSFGVTASETHRAIFALIGQGSSSAWRAY